MSKLARQQEAGRLIRFLEDEVRLPLTDARDALSIDPPYVDVASSRIEMALAAIQREIEKLERMEG